QGRARDLTNAAWVTQAGEVLRSSAPLRCAQTDSDKSSQSVAALDDTVFVVASSVDYTNRVLDDFRLESEAVTLFVTSHHPKLHSPGFADHVLVPWRVPRQLHVGFVDTIDA